MRRIFLLSFALVILSSLNAHAATRTWDGGGVDDNWLTPANWVGDVAPASGDDLVFPTVATKYTSNNNFGFGSTVRSITFEGGIYTISGSPIIPQRLSNGLTVIDGTQTINIVFQLTAAQTFAATNATGVAILGGVVMGSNALTIDGAGGIGLGLISGSGQLIKNGTGGGLVAAAAGYSGQVAVNGGALILDATMASSSVTVNALPAPSTFDMKRFGIPQTEGLAFAGGVGGTGTVGAVNIINGAISAGTLSSPNGIFNTGNLNIGSGGTYGVKISGSAPGQNGHDQINVTGSVTLQDAQLEVLPVETAAFRMKQAIVIIKNDGADAINGTFLGLPEGAYITSASGTFRFRISYHGGDGNDVILIRSALRGQ